MSQISLNNTFLSFYLGKELFGIEVKYILEVLKDEHVTEIPRSEKFIKGIINFRGEIVTVIDFHDKMNMPSKQRGKQEIIIAIELFEKDKNIKVGLLAEKVKKVFEIAANDIKTVPEFGEYYNPEFLTGVAKIEDEIVMLLDIEKVLNEKEVTLVLESNKQKTKN